MRAVCSVKPITIQVYDRGLRLAERYDFPIYDAMIVATALVSFIRVQSKWILARNKNINRCVARRIWRTASQKNKIELLLIVTLLLYKINKRFKAAEHR